MSINITNIGIVKTINKPWGYEKWIADGSPEFKYALKEIFFKANNKSSIQFHQFKEETTYVLKGKGILHYSMNPINFDKFNSGSYSDDELNKLISNMKKLEIKLGTIYHIKPGIIHQVEAIEDLLFIESSTIELDDVIRFNDQWGRNSGKIETEHTQLNFLGNFYKSQMEKINFSKSYAKGKILLCTHGINTQYYCSKNLLDSDCQEVWHCDTLSNQPISIRKLENKSINYNDGPLANELPEKYFDLIISLEEIQYHNNPMSRIRFYDSLLKDGGKLIISTLNKDTISNSEKEISGFTKDDLLTIAKNFFSEISVFGQKNITILENPKLSPKNTLLSKIRNNSKKILQTFDKNENFYKLHLQKTIIKMRKTKQKLRRHIIDESYSVFPYTEKDHPKYLLLLCEK